MKQLLPLSDWLVTLVTFNNTNHTGTSKYSALKGLRKHFITNQETQTQQTIYSQDNLIFLIFSALLPHMYGLLSMG